MRAMLQVENILVDIPSADATVHFHLHKVTKREAYFLCLFGKFSRRWKDKHLRLSHGQFERIQRPERKDAGLTRATLTLHDNVPTLDYRKNGTLLHSRGFIETIGVQTSEKCFRNAKLVEAVYDLELLWRFDNKLVIATNLSRYTTFLVYLQRCLVYLLS